MVQWRKLKGRFQKGEIKWEHVTGSNRAARFGAVRPGLGSGKCK